VQSRSGRTGPLDAGFGDRVEKAAQKTPGYRECHVVTGEFDHFMLIRTRDSDSFNWLHAKKLLYCPACGRFGPSSCYVKSCRRPSGPS